MSDADSDIWAEAAAEYHREREAKERARWKPNGGGAWRDDYVIHVVDPIPQEPPDLPPPIGEPAKRAESARIFEVIRPREWRGREIPEMEWIVPGIVPSEAVTSLYGDGGKGKSRLALQLQGALACGGEWCGRALPPMQSFGFYCEDTKLELMRRWRQVEEHYQLTEDDCNRVGMMSLLGDDNAMATVSKGGKVELTPLHKRILELLLEEHARLAIFDTKDDFLICDENNRTQVRAAVQMGFGSIARAINGAVMFLAHPSRAGMTTGTGDSGTTGWNGVVRSRAFFRDGDTPEDAMPDEDARVLELKKANYASSGVQIRLRYRNGVFVEDRPEGFSFRAPVEDVFLDLLDAMTAEKRFVSHKRVAPNFAAREFARHPRRQGYRDKDFERAMEKLFEEKKIRVVEDGPPSRRRERIGRA